MTKHTIIAAAMAAATLGASAANDMMYLVKGNHVIAKYDVDDVDYVAFELPGDVLDENIWLGVDKVGKNTVTYTVNTSANDIAYAHNILSYWDVNYTAMDMFGEMLNDLDEESVMACLKYTLSSNAFVGIGTNKYTQNDFQQYDNYSEANRFSVMPGTKYYLCAWEVDPNTTEPLNTFVYQELTTEQPEQADLNLDVQFDKLTEHGAVLKITGDQEVLYVRTCWGMKDMMEAYQQYYGMDFLMGTFGQNWSLPFLAGTGDLEPGVENATWPVYDPGEYIMYVRAYDYQGNVQDASYVYEYKSDEGGEAPTITIFSKEKSEGHVKINFEISPSNVEEAYVRMLSENTVDDRLNMGYTYPDLAMGGDAVDITNAINTVGEYTFESNEVPDQWNSILIYAKSKDGGKTTLRLNFYPDTDTEWSTYAPFHAPARKMPKITGIRRANCPVIRK